MKITRISPSPTQNYSQGAAPSTAQNKAPSTSESRFEKASSAAAQAVSQSAQSGGVGQILGKIAQGAKNVAVGAVLAGAAIGLTGCGEAPAPSPGLDVSFSLRNGVEVKGEAPDHAEFRIKTAPKKAGGHRALDDIRESLEELRHYRQALFVSRDTSS